MFSYSREHAALFAAISGTMGTYMLYSGVNTLTCCLGVTNYLLYTAVYTPMKRLSPSNTWVGSMVGALPPVMGWAAATGSVDLGIVLCKWYRGVTHNFDHPVASVRM